MIVGKISKSRICFCYVTSTIIACTPYSALIKEESKNVTSKVWWLRNEKKNNSEKGQR